MKRNAPTRYGPPCDRCGSAVKYENGGKCRACHLRRGKVRAAGKGMPRDWKRTGETV